MANSPKLKLKLDSTPLQSKKFVAAMIWNLIWLVLIGHGINAEVDASVLTAMVYVSGSVQCLYLGGQAAVDTFVRRAFAKNGEIKKIVTEPLTPQNGQK